jgi:hypothetical protein
MQLVYQFHRIGIPSADKPQTLAHEPCKRTYIATRIAMARGSRRLFAGDIAPCIRKPSNETQFCVPPWEVSARLRCVKERAQQRT